MRDTAERKWASGTLWERSMQRAELPCGALPFVYLTRDRREPPQQRGGFRIFGRRLEGALRTCKFPCTSADRTGLVGGGVLDAPSRKAAVFAKACLLPCRVLRDCHVGLRPPRNDKSVCLTPPNYRLNTCNCLGRSLSAATDAIGACHFNDSLYQLAAVRRERHAAPLQCTTDGLCESAVPSRDCHVATLLAMTNRETGAAADSQLQTGGGSATMGRKRGRLPCWMCASRA